MQRLGNVLPALRVPRPSGGGSRPTTQEKACPICNGAGWVRADVPVGDPNFGRTFMCECLLSQVEGRRLDELQRFSRLEGLQGLTFDSFDASVPGTAEAYRAAREFAREPRGWLVFYGGFGVGKTHLAAAIANDLVASGARVLFQIVPDLLDHLRSAFAPTSDLRYDELFELVKSVPVLVLDELAEESQTPWAEEKLFQLFNHRYIHRLPTVVTTNRPPDAIDPRIWSRLFDRSLAVSVEVGATDYRMRARTDRRQLKRGARPPH